MARSYAWTKRQNSGNHSLEQISKSGKWNCRGPFARQAIGLVFFKSESSVYEALSSGGKCARRRCKMACARLRRDATVPGAQPSAAAISS